MELQTAMCCAKCKEILNSADVIFGTSCGHLYHFPCLRECHGKSEKCSHCEYYKPSIFKMFIEFKNGTPSWEDQIKTIELVDELEQSKNKIHFLEEKYQISQLSVQKLEGKLKVVSDALQSKDITVANLESTIEKLEVLNKFLNEEKSLLAKNFCNISTKTFDEKCSTSESKTKHESIGINILASKKHKRLESWKNIKGNENEKKSSFVAAENVSYKGTTNYFNSKEYENYSMREDDTLDLKKASSTEISKENHNESDCEDSTKISHPTEITKNSKENYNKCIEFDTKKIANETKNVGNPTQNIYEDGIPEQNLEEHSKNSHLVVIENYPLKNLEKWSKEEIVIYVASKMRIQLSINDITRVIVIKNSLKGASLVVVFKNVKIKQRFLSGNKFLKKYQNLKFLVIRE